MTLFKHLGEIVSAAAEAFAPPSRMTVSEAAEKYRYLKNQGSDHGPWDNNTTPYLVEPMDTLTAREFDGMAFCGPAQSGKTDALQINWLVYSVKVDPMDLSIYSPTSAAARDFSMRRIDRLHRDSQTVGAMLLNKRDADNKFDKQYKNGVLLALAHPSVTEFAGKPIPRVGITDYDRFDDNIEGDGNAFDLASKRTTSFGSFAMCMAESSPSRDIDDPKWIRLSEHQAPPVKGILALYNRGDRRLWYWPCPDCGTFFVGDFKHLTWDKTEANAMAAADTVRMVCPHCNYKIHPDMRYDMNIGGRWLKDGQKIDRAGVITGEGQWVRMATFWLNGVAAVFTNWVKLVRLWIEADKEYQSNGTEEALKKFFNNDLGVPYKPKAIEAQRTPEDLKARSESYGTKDDPAVPYGTRFLIATIDVQTNMFIVQVHGIMPGKPFDTSIVDRFRIKLSDGSIRGGEPAQQGRLDEDGQVSWVKPGTYTDDWNLITELVLKRTYPLADGSGRRMMIKVVGCDSGGEAGVTSMAYTYYRRLRAEGLASRFQLVKGDPKPGVPRVRISYPDSSDSKNKAAAQGDVPLLMISSTQVKDMLSNRLDSTVPGTGMIKFPEWLEDWFYAELVSETRTEKGWEKIGKSRNEAWDLLYYMIGIAISGRINVESIDWDNPLSWAAPWDTNSLVSQRDKPLPFAISLPAYDWAAAGKELA